MDHAWIEFLRGEDPASRGLPAWPAYDSDTRATMAFDTKCHVERHPQDTELQLWNGLL
jgi:para-nitrobenzyl esterase